ncbi:hypothetical protein [Streptomyces qinglanensis]|uniref:Uncharacterized protein n=1 Tax=Streptomyces qinglanensis TaxID=943816 RepID=A0A1H9U3D5_9ACTN|nr:hypothetical protein [Streptomyces qinglanensis]SES03822.1 hypothetical protein SAMN05421870_107276 [Streptomyces qinglanensis]
MALFRSDRELADTKYSGKQSASDRASARRRADHRKPGGGADRALRAGQDWDDAQRHADIRRNSQRS